MKVKIEFTDDLFHIFQSKNIANRRLEKSHERKELEKNMLFEKNLCFERKKMSLEHFETQQNHTLYVIN